jgi:hypothetical protein
MATITVTKGQIGVEDITFMTGGDTTGETFSRATSTGGSQAVHKLSAKAIPVEDSGSVWTATNVEEVLNDIQDGTDVITLNAASVMTSVKDGSANTVKIPTNNPGAASFMLGTADSTIVWMYLNAAPPGWKVTTTGADTVLGVKATAKSSGTADGDTANHLIDVGSGDFVNDGVVVGDVAYNTDDGTSALVTAVAATDLTLASDAFPDGNEAYEVGTRFIDPGGTAADEGSWDLSGSYTIAGEAAHTHGIGTLAVNVTHAVGGDTGLANGAEYPTNARDNAVTSSGGSGSSAAGSSHTHTISSDSKDRPAASIGRLFMLDSA